MFPPPRFVVVDDNGLHLDAIASAVQMLGSACARVLYDIENDVPVEPFRGARVIFIDLQLQDRALTTDFNRHFAEIQRILAKVINPDGGPYLLIVWTDNPTRVTELEIYLERFFSENPHTRPAALVPLSKTDFIELDTGKLLGSNGELRTAILERLNGNPAMAALVQWEVDVLEGASRVLADIVGLASGPAADPAALPTLLRRIANEAVGATNADSDPRYAVHAALLPLLQDHLQNTVIELPPGNAWENAFEGAPEILPNLTKDQVSVLNTKLHITQPSTSVAVVGTSWGAICELEDAFAWSEFGYSSVDDYLDKAVGKGIRNPLNGYRANIKIVQVRIGAACDYAQKPDGPIPYVLAAFVPERSEAKPHSLYENSTGWLSPTLKIGNMGAGQLFVDPRFTRVRGDTVAEAFVALGRMKEQLLLELIAAVSHHASRPGIVRFIANG